MVIQKKNRNTETIPRAKNGNAYNSVRVRTPRDLSENVLADFPPEYFAAFSLKSLADLSSYYIRLSFTEFDFFSEY